MEAEGTMSDAAIPSVTNALQVNVTCCISNITIVMLNVFGLVIVFDILSGDGGHFRLKSPSS